MSSDRSETARGKRGELERALGLGEATTIGVGTMIGAGIFVFPGLAVGGAGPAAALSFAIGAAIALLVALPASELATAMPRSGGGYYFVSRALGAKVGALVGLGQWVGLIFASAFYLAGFGHYLVDLLDRTGLDPGLSPPLVGFVTALLLTAMAIVGTRSSGRLQYGVVALLLVILFGLLAWGAAKVTGLVGASSWPKGFATEGTLPILSTAALVFTSYLGFAQIANVAGEIKNPSTNLPRAMTGSVLIVGTLYVVTILVSAGVLGIDRMAEAGETAMTEVGKALFGALGGLIVGMAGLLATFSSANASILGSSRAVFALSRDELVPEAASRVSRRFRTPHVALLLTGGAIALLVLLGRLEILAEVASILHLLMYGLICLAVPILRRKASLWYRPAFRAPLSPWLPGLGALLCFGLVGFMSPAALLYAGIVLAAAGLWHLAYARGVEIRAVEELAPAPGVTGATLLLQVQVPGPPGISEALIRALSPDHLILLGWSEVPEQSDPEQVRDRLGSDAETDLEEIAARIREFGMRVETELVFTGNLARTIDRVAEEHESTAILSLRPVNSVDEILVALFDRARRDAALGYAARIARATGARIHLLCLDGEQQQEGPEPQAELLRKLGPATTEGRIRSTSVAGGEAEDRILEAVGEADLVIVGEMKKKQNKKASTNIQETVTRRAKVPVLILKPSGPQKPDAPPKTADEESGHAD